MTMNRLIFKIATVAAALLWLISGGLWAKSAHVRIHNDIDVIVGDMLRTGYWNSWAAYAAFAAAVATGVAAICEVLRR
jgi:hypothetical protein